MALAAGVAGAGCSSSSHHPAPALSAQQLLAKAKATADASSAVHFSITSQNVSFSGTNLVSGDGDLVRPNSMQGSFKVAVSGVLAAVQIVSVGGIFEAKLPFASGFVKTDPAQLGLTDPATLLDPNKGLTSLLVGAQNPTLGPSTRDQGELLDTVSYSVPGTAIPVIPDLKPSEPVELTIGIDPNNFQMRTVTMVGPFTSATSNSTYVVTLTNYDEKVTVTLPPAS